MNMFLHIFGYFTIGGLTMLLFIRDCVREGSFTPDDAWLVLLCGLGWPIFVFTNVITIIIPEYFKKIIIPVAAIFEKEMKEKKP